MSDPLWILNYEGPTWREQGEEWTRFARPPLAREATFAEKVAALRECEGVEELMEVTDKNAPVLSDGRYLPPGTYLVVPVEGDPQ